MENFNKIKNIKKNLHSKVILVQSKLDNQVPIHFILIYSFHRSIF